MNPWIFLVAFCACLGATAQILFKASLSGQIELIKLGLGFTLYGVSFVLYLLALRHLEVSVAYPVIAISYPIVAILSYYSLNEPWSVWKTAGTVGILLSVAVIGR